MIKFDVEVLFSLYVASPEKVLNKTGKKKEGGECLFTFIISYAV